MYKQAIDKMLSNRFCATPLVIEKAEGAFLTTTSGVQYTDFVLGNLTQLMGHRRVEPVAQLENMLGKMLNVGDNAHDLMAGVAADILSIAKKDKLRFTNSGSEAAHLAIRLARASTGRDKILKFVGHYHGWFNEEIGTFLSVPASQGIPADTLSSVINVDWNDKVAVTRAFEDHGDSIAAVICEPCLAHAGTIPPFDNFLEFLRDISSNYGAFLIFDECITGFRLGLGGAQELYNVQSDLVVYSKAISNGVPFGVVAGTELAMAPADDWRVFHASTYDSNPISLLMVGLVIKELREGAHFDNIQRNVDRLSSGIVDLCSAKSIDLLIQRTTAYFSLYFTSKQRISNYRESMETNYSQYSNFVKKMMEARIIVSEGELQHPLKERNWIGSWFMSSAHTDETINNVLKAVDISLDKIK